MENKRLYIILGILVIFIITNPSVSAFKTFRGRDSYDGLYRPINLFVFSVYKDHRHRFIGVFGNFLDIGYQHDYNSQSVNQLDSTRLADSSRSSDSAKMADSAYTNHLK